MQKDSKKAGGGAKTCYASDRLSPTLFPWVYLGTWGNPEGLAAAGEVAEWLKAITCYVIVFIHRGFESRLLRFSGSLAFRGILWFCDWGSVPPASSPTPSPHHAEGQRSKTKPQGHKPARPQRTERSSKQTACLCPWHGMAPIGRLSLRSDPRRP